MRSCGMNFIKTILFIFNFIFAISGLGVLIAGALVLADVGEFSHFIEGRVVAPPIVLIVVGALVFLVASLGCYGAIRESPPLLTLFAVCLAIIFIVELAVGIAAIAFKSDLEQAIRTTLQKSIRNSNAEDLSAWDNVQKKLHCCGLDGPADWVDLSRDRYLRPSCCRPEYIDAQSKDCRNALPLHKDKYYQDGCADKLKMRVDSNASILIGVGIGIAFIQILGIILACLLANAIRNENAK
ncbi:tetraspanin-7 [Lutzomyia longipalpis]|uniref:tetraspanin-7 n=1 Tax=Lutzomyia longipalpis TaxID=7200 RepID=UPI002484523B|nr:tetraspanin-7 [Lutzomyia longipalpis]